MKRCLLLLSFLLTAPLLRAQTPFTYQGKLENTGAPFTGIVHIRLGLFSAASGGVAIRTETMPAVVVTNGMFTVTPATFVPADFPGAARYLNIEVSGDAGGSYTPLTPRQQVTWTPYAIHASTASSATTAGTATTATTATSVTGSVSATQLTGTLNPSLLGTGSIGGTVTFNPASGAPFSVGANTNLVTNLNADRLDGLSSTSFLRATGGALSGDLDFISTTEVNFGAVTRQMLNLFNADYGIGVQSDTLYARSYNDFSWHRQGVHINARNNPGFGGSEMMRLASDNTLWLRPETTSTPRARMLFGDLHPTNGQPFVSIGESQDDDDVLEITGRKIRIKANNGPSVPPSITFGQTTGQHLVLYEGGGDTYGIGVQGYYQYFRTGDSFAWYRDGIHNDSAGNPGGGTTLMTLGPTGTLLVQGTESGVNVTNRDSSSQEWAMYSRNSGGVGQLAFWNSTTGTDTVAFSPNGDMYLVGEISTSVLTVRGGADVAEPFEMTKPDEMDPGTVVVIDEDQPGQLRKSTGSYDKCVAGIISGAGGVKPGLRLHQVGVMEGDHHVALSGRVYVKADASFGKIKPGDLLTTSSTAGHAMKVEDHEKAQGAILGKAMSKLDKGTGLVLVLVTLQ